MKRARVVLGKKEIEKLRRGESVIVRLKSEEVEIRASLCVDWNFGKPPIGSFESILDHLKS